MKSILDDPPRVAMGPGSRERPLARFGLIGDVHAEDERLATSLALGRREGVEAFLCVGDVADGFGDLARTIALLEREHVHVVAGNHDRWFLADEMRSLVPIQHRQAHPEAVLAARLWPPVLELETIRGPLLLGHGVADDDSAVLKSDTDDDTVRELDAWSRLLRVARYRFVAGGHTHQAMVRTLDGITMLNPGTLKRDKTPCTAIVDLALGQMRLFSLEAAHEPTDERVLTIP